MRQSYKTGHDNSEVSVATVSIQQPELLKDLEDSKVKASIVSFFSVYILIRQKLCLTNKLQVFSS